jgi:hypothetical protein
MTTVNNLSGQQKADQNLATFLSWAASKTDADYREMVLRGQLNRKEIARECGFAKSVLLQNPRVKDALRTLEAQLRERNILPPVVEPAIPAAPTSDAPNPRAAADKARLKRLEAENAALRAEVMELARPVGSLPPDGQRAGQYRKVAPVSLPSFTVRVSAIRRQNPQGRGGAIFTGIEVGDDGARIDAKAHLVVKAPHWLLNTADRGRPTLARHRQDGSQHHHRQWLPPDRIHAYPGSDGTAAPLR